MLGGAPTWPEIAAEADRQRRDLNDVTQRAWEGQRREEIQRDIAGPLAYAAQAGIFRPQVYMQLVLNPVYLQDQQREQEAARARARKLFLSFLDSEQRSDAESGMPVKHEGKLGYYLIGETQRVVAYLRKLPRKLGGHQVSKPGKYSLCVAPDRAYETPSWDVYLAQLLHLRADEEGFLAVSVATAFPAVS